MQGVYAGYVYTMVVQLTAPLAQIIIGLYLFFGARGLSGFWQSLRRAGLNKPDDGEDDAG